MAKQNELSFYNEIQQFIGAQLQSNIRTKRLEGLKVFWGIGELKARLTSIVRAHPEKCACVNSFLRTTPPLNLDIFALITNGKHFELLILEVKLLKSAGLKEWSQLVGYCLVSGAKYGLLINIDGDASSRLREILSTTAHLSCIETTVNGHCQSHHLGFMQWDSVTKDFQYSNLGEIKSLSSLCERICESFE